MLPEVPTASDEVPYPTEPPTSFSSLVTDLAEDGAGKPFIDPEVVIQALAGNRYLQLASGLDRPHLLRRFMVEWSTETALRDCESICPGCKVNVCSPLFIINDSCRTFIWS
jgi:hypothetical protein